MAAALKHLTPVTLELGGKCPTIVDSLSAPLDLKVPFLYITFIISNHKLHAIKKFAGLHLFAVEAI